MIVPQARLFELVSGVVRLFDVPAPQFYMTMLDHNLRQGQQLQGRNMFSKSRMLLVYHLMLKLLIAKHTYSR